MLRYGTIGTGWIAAKFIESANTVEGLRFTAAYSRSLAKARGFAGQNGCSQVFDSLEEMAASPLLDAVYIASPNALHYEQSLLFLRHGKHVLCEKPVASSPERVQALLDTARENGVVFAEAIMNTRVPQFELLRSALPRLGRLSLARLSFCQLSSKYPLLRRYDAGEGELPNIFNPALETGAAMDIGVYCVYPALALFGGGPEISARAVRHKNGIDLCGTAVLGYEDLQVELSYSKIADGRAPSEIQGDQGTLLIERISQLGKLEFVDRDGARELIFELAPEELPMRYEAERFLSYVCDPAGTREQYEADSRLAVQVSAALREIRRCSGLPF